MAQWPEELIMQRQTPWKMLCACLLLGATLPAFAHDDGQEQIGKLREEMLQDAPGKRALMITVSYQAGQKSTAHVHPGSVFAYVLEGSVVSQLQGHEPVIYKTGESWYEPANTPHLVSRNASDTQPAKLLVWLLLDEKAPVKLPLPQ
jgi:quercetin dioxygenase-like cupin family protein